MQTTWIWINRLYTPCLELSAMFNTFLFTKGAVAYSRSHYGRGQGPVHLSQVQCTGLESNLTECSNYNIIRSISTWCEDHSRDASVLCPIGM